MTPDGLDHDKWEKCPHDSLFLPMPPGDDCPDCFRTGGYRRRRPIPETA